MAPKKVDKGEKKRTILVAAMKVFARNGVKNSLVSDIASEAGIGKGTIYEYFRSRDEILVEVFVMMMGDMHLSIERETAHAADPVEELKAMVRVTWDFFNAFPAESAPVFLDFWSEWLRSSEKNAPGGMDFCRLYEHYREGLADIIRRGVAGGHFVCSDPRTVSSIYIAVIDGLILQMIVDPGAYDRDTAVENIMQLTLHGLLKR